MSSPDEHRPDDHRPDGHRPDGDAELDRRLQQLSAEQAAAAPPPLPWDQVERRPASSTPGGRRGWAAAAATVLVVGAAVLVITARGAEAPTTLTPADTTPATAPADEAPPAPGATEPTAPVTTEPDGNDGDASMEIPHRVLLDGEPVGPVWSVTVANTADEQDALWAQLELDLDIDPELVDPATNVVIHFGPAASSSCPFGPLAAVRHDPATGHLYPELPVEGGPGCTDDANPHAVVVVVDRADLPDEAFTVWVANDDPPACCTDDVIRVDAGELATPPEPAPDTPPDASESTSPEPTTPEPTTPEEELPAGVTETTGIDIPSGDIQVGPADLAIAHADGDLWYHPGILGAAPTAPFRLAELADPRDPVVEGPPPNQVDHVAGVHEGAVVYGDCCEPVSGNVLAADGADSERLQVMAGFTPVLDPTGRRLATANSFFVAVVDLTTGTQWSRMLDDEADMPVDVWGVTWVADGESLVMLTSGADGFSLQPFTGTVPLEPGVAVPIGVEFDPTLTRQVSIAGVASDGAIAVAVVETDGAAPTFLRFHDADTLEEDPSRRIGFGPGTTSIRVDGDEMLWIEDEELYHRVGDGPARLLGDGYRAAWFIR